MLSLSATAPGYTCLSSSYENAEIYPRILQRRIKIPALDALMTPIRSLCTIFPFFALLFWGVVDGSDKSEIWLWIVNSGWWQVVQVKVGKLKRGKCDFDSLMFFGLFYLRRFMWWRFRFLIGLSSINQVFHVWQLLSHCINVVISSFVFWLEKVESLGRNCSTIICEISDDNRKQCAYRYSIIIEEFVVSEISDIVECVQNFVTDL